MGNDGQEFVKIDRHCPDYVTLRQTYNDLIMTLMQ